MAKHPKLILGGLTAAAAALVTVGAGAQTISTHCGVNTQTATAAIYYDPFNPNPVSSVSVNLPLTRYVGSHNGSKTQQMDFYFTQPTSAAAYQIIYSGNNVLYTQSTPGVGGGAPSLSTTTTPSGTVGLNFGGTTQPDTLSVPVTISLPAGLDMSNGYSVQFGIVYECNGTGSNFDDEPSPAYLAGAITMPVFVLDALQAYYAGPALDFGQIGQVTQAQVTASPATYTKTGVIHIASSGPYTVAMRSLAADPYRMTYSGGSTATTGQYIPYKVKLLNQTKDNASPTFTTVSCVRAGVTGGQDIGISATLEDSGVGKTPAAYQDNLEVTITPLVAAPSPGSCL